MASSTVEQLVPDQSHACLFLMVDNILNKLLKLTSGKIYNISI